MEAINSDLYTTCNREKKLVKWFYSDSLKTETLVFVKADIKQNDF